MANPCVALVLRPPYNRCVLPFNHPWKKPEGHVYEDDASAIARKPVGQEESMSDEFGTPRSLYDRLNEAFGEFTLDGSANSSNTLVPGSFLSVKDDAPSCDVGSHNVWLNPPYSRGNLDRFMGWARAQTIRSAPRFTCLVPAYTGEGWWQRHVWGTSDKSNESPLGPFHGISEVHVPGVGLFICRAWSLLSISVHLVPGRIEFVCPPHVEANGARFSSAVVVYERTHR